MPKKTKIKGFFSAPVQLTGSLVYAIIIHSFFRVYPYQTPS